jgi:hypothetical protein
VKSSRAAERDRANHPHRIFAQPHVRIANRAHDAGAQIVEAADVVDDRESGDVVEQRVDREVAAERVLFRRAERVVVVNEVLAFGVDGSGAGTPSCTIPRRARPGGGTSRPRSRSAELHVGEAEAAADDPAVPETVS